MNEKNVLCISGGKDSTALWIYATKVLKKDVLPIFCDTGNEHPLTYLYLEYLQKQLGELKIIKADFTKQLEQKKKYVKENWGKDLISSGKSEEEAQNIVSEVLKNLNPTGNNFLDLCKWKGRFPSTKARFCTQELKVIPTAELIYIPLLEQGFKVFSWVGVRADESLARSKLEEYEEVPEGWTIYRPLLKWTVEDVFAIHREFNIEPNPLYKQGMKRVGCMPCINTNKDELFQISLRFEEEINRIAKWEEEVSKVSKRQHASFFPWVNGDDKSDIHQWVNWAKTVHGGRQVDILKVIESENLPTCSSVYGLCE